MTLQQAAERLRNIVRVWEMQIGSYPKEVQEAQTTLVVLRGPDIEAMRIALATMTAPAPTPPDAA